MNIKLTAKRLKKLRTEAGYSHERLASALIEKYNIKITPASLKKYEIAEQPHSNYGAVRGMRIEYLYMFADFYDVSSDYILGFTNSINRNITTKHITDKTGLSNKAIENLEILYKETKTGSIPPYLVIDYMLSNQEFMENYPNTIISYYLAKKMSDKKFNTSAPEYYNSQWNIESIEFRKYLSIQRMERLIDSFYNNYVDYDIEKELSLLRKDEENGNKNK